jgi:predicted AAA+ superfamily ATPase
MRFLLTGSSARKLRRGGANLLAGRDWEAQLFPLTYVEIEDFELLKYLNTSGLPAIYGNPESKEELIAYVGTYLAEEISAEAATKNLAAFSEFLTLCALSNGEEINFESMARDCGISPSTLKAYFQILSDTLVGFELSGYTKTKKRKSISRAKHYFFDIGIVSTLCKRGRIEEKSELFGKAFEHFIILEIHAYNSYARKMQDLNYWRSTSQYEVDLIVGGNIAIEIKETALVQDKHLKGLRALKEEKLQKNSFAYRRIKRKEKLKMELKSGLGKAF